MCYWIQNCILRSNVWLQVILICGGYIFYVYCSTTKVRQGRTTPTLQMKIIYDKSSNVNELHATYAVFTENHDRIRAIKLCRMQNSSGMEWLSVHVQQLMINTVFSHRVGGNRKRQYYRRTYIKILRRRIFDWLATNGNRKHYSIDFWSLFVDC